MRNAECGMQTPGQQPPPLPLAAIPVEVTLECATPRNAGGIAWQKSDRHLHVGFEAPRSPAAGTLIAASAVMVLAMGIVAILFCSGVMSNSSYTAELALSFVMAGIALPAPAIAWFIFRRRRSREPMARPVELDVTPEGLSLLIPARSPTPIFWPVDMLREIRCTAVPGAFCIEVFPATTLPEEHWFNITGEIAPELVEMEMRQILRLGELAMRPGASQPLSYATPAPVAMERDAPIPWIRRRDYLLVLLPPPKALPTSGCIMSAGLLGAVVAFLRILAMLLELQSPAIPVACLFVGATLLGSLAAVLIGRRNRSSPNQRDRATVVMACPGRLWIHLRSARNKPEALDAGPLCGLTITAESRGLRLNLQTTDGASVSRLLRTTAVSAGPGLCDGLRHVLGARA
jgi:hypothetical protein